MLHAPTMPPAWNVILGPPGCGKTGTLLRLLGTELENGATPGRIAFVSYTRAARKEAVSRVERDFNLDRENLPWFRTIHSAAYRLLGLERDQIMTSKRWKQFNDRYHYDLTDPHAARDDPDNDPLEPPRHTEDDIMRYVYEWGRNRRLNVERSMGRCPVNVDAPFFRLFAERLAAFKAKHGLLDFTDVLERAIAEDRRPDVDVAFIDEAQDLSPLQIAVVESWFKPCRKVYVAGDEDQAIFAFQGAEPEWLISLSRAHPTVILNQSYRLPAAIHTFAHKIIRRNRRRVDKPFLPATGQGRIECLAIEDAFGLIDGKTDTLVLVRNRMFLSRFAEPLLAGRVPYLVEGAGGKNPLGSPKVVRAVITAHKLAKGEDVAARDLNLMLALVPCNDSNLLPRGAKKKAKEREGVLTREGLLNLGLGALLEAVRKSGPLSVLKKVRPEFRDYFQALLERHGCIPEPRVRLTTIHGSKGREADLVIVLPDMTKATFLEFCDGGNGGNEAENRVAYVAVTRAKRHLVIVQPLTRRYYDYPVVK